MNTKKKYTNETKEKIIKYFLTNKNNSQKQIALTFNVTIHTVNSILDKHFKQIKINNK